ncbi:TonB-linked SusC/RagA family outer membrane protein [Flavobacterium sp. PL11]|jgi:TonB-linked SusC/RagA family outer membrane protein|uniref:SusC/RagA family TonB-linked outer membrane protein n=1 Tax=Flavobacterium sp. PL11 TaxID=3071717 RepID=UPI002E03CA31|nr:TonB-linked SusC/RagA family outer membrane protein [Flavobacterium sp. PL11]
MIKKHNTYTIFKIKKIAIVQLVLGTFMVSTAYAETSKINEVVTPTSVAISNKNIAFEKITGQVVDEQGNTLPGVNVIKKGSTTGVSTDMDGNFTIDANKGEILVFSYIGFLNQEIQIRDNKNLKIILKSEAMQMNEVVIVGYGSQKKTNLTGSVTQIDSKVLKDRPITRLSQGLQGAVGGLNIISNGGAPNATQSINIRGFTGLGSSGSPLIVIDGIQGGDINSINANDVESISVIKDAAASAVYGSSAPYGVILIKTKQGKKGQPVSITYNNNFTFEAPIGLPKMLNSLEFAKIYNQSLANGGGAAFFNQNTLDRMAAFQNGSLTIETEANTTGDSYKAWGGANANNDWYKIYFKDVSSSQQHNLGVSGATDNSSYYVGLGYNKKEGMYRYGDDNYKRYNLRANLSSNLTEWLTFNFRGAFSQDKFDTPNTYNGKTGGNYMHQIGRKHPNLALYNPDGGISDESDVLLLKDGGRNISINDKPTFTGEFVTKFTKQWTATVNYTYDGAFNNQTSHVKTLYTTLPSGMLREVGGTAPNSFSRYFSKYQKNILNAFTSYDLELKKHQIKFLGGYVQELTAFSSLNGSNNNLYSDKIPSIQTSYGTTPSVSDNAYKLAIQGYFGRINYSYDDKYLLEVTGRYDGTSRFLKDVRWKAYPGISIGWNVNKENFWKEGISDVVNTLKFRASYGSLGDQAPDLLGNYPFYPSLGTVSPTSSNWFFGSTRQPYVNTPGLVDPSLTWVTATTRNFGVDASFLNRRLTATFDTYIRKMDDYIGPAQELPGVLGISAPRTNSTSMETKGFELTLAWNDNIGDFKYGVRGVLSDYHGRVTKYPNPDKLLNNWFEGENMGDIWGFVTDRYFTSDDDLPNVKQLNLSNWSAGDIKYVDLNGDGKIDYGNSTVSNPGDRKVIGNSTPRYSYSFFTDGSWKGFDYSIFIQGVGQRDYYTTSNMYFGIVGSEWQSSLFSEHLDRWSPDNPNGFFPKAYIGGGNWWKNTETQTKYLLNAAYLRIKNAQVGYTLPANISNQVKIQKLRFYISVDNLGTFTKMSDHSVLDPENAFSDAKLYPLQRSVSIGANITL